MLGKKGAQRGLGDGYPVAGGLVEGGADGDRIEGGAEGGQVGVCAESEVGCARE